MALIKFNEEFPFYDSTCLLDKVGFFQMIVIHFIHSNGLLK